MSRDFPSTFFCSIYFFFLLLVSCFYTLRPFQIVLLTLSCGAGRREIMRFVGRRVQGIYPCVPSFYTVSQLGELRNLPVSAPHMQNGELWSLKALLRGIFHSSPILTSGWVKNRYCCAWLVFPRGVELLFQFPSCNSGTT